MWVFKKYLIFYWVNKIILFFNFVKVNKNNMYVYKEINDEIKKLLEIWFLLKNYVVVFIFYIYVCKFIL